MFINPQKFAIIILSLLLSANPICSYDILDRTLDLSQWPNHPQGCSFQFSSYDRYGGNIDQGNFLGTDPDGSRIMAEISGPGVISRIWVTNYLFPHNARFRIYVDDITTAVIDTTLRQFFGQANPFIPPLADSAAGAYYSYVPIHFQDTCRVTLLTYPPGQSLYFQVTGIQFPETTQVNPFTLPLPPGWALKLQSWASMWDSAGNCPQMSPDTIMLQTNIAISPGQQDTLISIPTPGVLRSLIITPDPFTREILQQLILRIYWDGSTSPSIEGSAADIFGSHWGTTTMTSIPIGCDPPNLYSYFPCPFNSCVIIAASEYSSPIALQTEAAYTDENPGNMRFHTATREETLTPYGQDYLLLSIQGKGHYMGCQLYMETPTWWDDHTYLEGDQHITVDGETFPSIHGTGTEDDFNGGYYFLYHPFLRPIHGAPWWSNFPPQSAAYRFHITDPVPFDSSITVSTEHGPVNNVPNIYHSVAYHYQEKYQLDFYDPIPIETTYPGEHVELFGWNFPPSSTITAYWGNTPVSTEPSNLITNSLGRFEAIITVPDTLPGYYRLGASPGGGQVSLCTRILEHRNDRLLQFSLSGMDTIAYPGVDSIFISGEGFIPGEQVTFQLSGNNLNCLEYPILVTSGSACSAVAIIPEIAPGSYCLTAIPSQGSPITCTDSIHVDCKWSVEAERLLLPIAYSHDPCEAGFMGYPQFEGHWSDNLQLDFQADALYDFMTLSFDIPESGYWEIHMAYTLCPDAGNFDIEFQYNGFGPVWHGYAPTTQHSGLLYAGTRFLSQQSNVTFRVVGRDPQSQNYWIGIDRLEFVPGNPPPADTVIHNLTITLNQGIVQLNWSPIVIDSLWQWIPASLYDIYRLSFPADSLNPANLLATIPDTSFVDSTIGQSAHHAYYRIIGRCMENAGSHYFIPHDSLLPTQETIIPTNQKNLNPTKDKTPIR